MPAFVKRQDEDILGLVPVEKISNGATVIIIATVCYVPSPMPSLASQPLILYYMQINIESA